MALPDESEGPPANTPTAGYQPVEPAVPLAAAETIGVPPPPEPTLPQPEVVIGYRLPRNRIAPPKTSEILGFVLCGLAGIACLIPGIWDLISNGLHLRGGYWNTPPACVLVCLTFGGLALRFVFEAWRESRIRRHAIVHVPRYCDRCGTPLTGLAVTRCPNCGHAHPDSAEAVAARQGQFAQPSAGEPQSSADDPPDSRPDSH